MIGAIETAPIVAADAASLFGGGFGRSCRTPGSEIGAATPRRQKRNRRVSPQPRCCCPQASCKPGVCRVKELSLVINGRSVKAEVEPRLNLVDFLREHQYLTATHIGCEHGVCGACTVLIDGVAARSCLTFAVAADRAAITTLEGFDNDPIMNVLREKFSEHHALQCGFCTPGMLMTARDIITRLPDADEKNSPGAGQLCRCTGYAASSRRSRVRSPPKASGQVQPSTHRPIGPVARPSGDAKDFSKPARGRGRAGAQPTPSRPQFRARLDVGPAKRRELRQSLPFLCTRRGLAFLRRSRW